MPLLSLIIHDILLTQGRREEVLKESRQASLARRRIWYLRVQIVDELAEAWALRIKAIHVKAS